MKSIFVFLGIVIALSSCTKFGKNMTVKGKVINPTTGEPIEGAVIELQKNTTGLPGGHKTVRETTSAADGSFEISKFGLRQYSIVCHKDSYYQVGWSEDGTLKDGYYRAIVKKGKVTHLDYYMIPLGDYKIDINNVNCQGPTDTIIIHRSNEAQTFLDIDWVLTGCNGYETATQSIPSGEIITNYRVIRNGVTTYYTTSFQVFPNQLNVQTINY